MLDRDIKNHQAQAHRHSLLNHRNREEPTFGHLIHPEWRAFPVYY